MPCFEVILSAMAVLVALHAGRLYHNCNVKVVSLKPDHHICSHVCYLMLVALFPFGTPQTGWAIWFNWINNSERGGV